jgi:hypothetical protein
VQSTLQILHLQATTTVTSPSSFAFPCCCRAFYQQHLQEQQEHLAKLQRALQATAAAGADADAVAAAGLDVGPRHAMHASSEEGAAVQLADDLQVAADQQLQAA